MCDSETASRMRETLEVAQNELYVRNRERSDNRGETVRVQQSLHLDNIRTLFRRSIREE